jgi:hypothetical protein
LEEAAKLWIKNYRYISNRPPTKRERPVWGQEK